MAGDKPPRYIPHTHTPRLGHSWDVCNIQATVASRVGAGVDPGSESGTCFRTNEESGGRSDRIAGRIAHGWGQAPALHFSVSALGGSLPSSRQSFTPAAAGTPRYEYRGPTSYQDSAIDPHPNPLPEGEGGELSSAGFPPRIAVRGRYDVAGGGNLLYIGKTPAIDL